MSTSLEQDVKIVNVDAGQLQMLVVVCNLLHGLLNFFL